MRTAPILLAIVCLLILPGVSAGSAADPEVKDASGDADPGSALDITAVWVNGTDPQNVTFHILVPKLPAPPATGGCAAPGCAALTFSFKLEFRVEAPDGGAAPTLAGYNRTYAVYRHGAPAGLETAIGSIDGKDVLTFNGHGSAKVATGGEIVLKVPRNNTAVNVPAGAAPGAYRIVNTVAYSSPQLCSPDPPAQPPVVSYPLATPCSSLSKPAQTTGTPPAGTTSRWDVAPDTGVGRAFVFDAPALPTEPVGTPTETATSSPAPPTQGPVAPPASSGTATQSTTTTSPPPSISPTPTTKATPAPEAIVLLALVAAGVAVRRRL
ncbi:MAG: hypothetical protein QOG31_647 [Thermoplasmata archaeon]|nr:hypothetical protein [Thermoplasmata archaeon]